MATAAKPEPISEDLLLAVYQSLLRYWIKQGVSKEKAEDLAQEGILKCLRSCEKWKRKAGAGRFRSDACYQRDWIDRWRAKQLSYHRFPRGRNYTSIRQTIVPTRQGMERPNSGGVGVLVHT
jgi:DNA-directed RNA polymerase specialized sigma24 family protein